MLQQFEKMSLFGKNFEAKVFVSGFDSSCIIADVVVMSEWQHLLFSRVLRQVPCAITATHEAVTGGVQSNQLGP